MGRIFYWDKNLASAMTDEEVDDFKQRVILHSDQPEETKAAIESWLSNSRTEDDES